MKNRDMFIDAMSGIDEDLLVAHLQKKHPTGAQKALRYSSIAAVYVAACLVVMLIIPFLMGTKGGVSENPEGTAAEPGVLPIATESSADSSGKTESEVPTEESTESIHKVEFPTATVSFLGCDFTITLDREGPYTLDDTIIATVTLTNNGDKPVGLWQGYLGDFLDEVEFYEDGEVRYSYSSDWDRGYAEACQWGPFEPGGSITHVVEFTPGAPNDTSDPVASTDSYWEIAAFVAYYEYVEGDADDVFERVQTATVTVEVPHEGFDGTDTEDAEVTTPAQDDTTEPEEDMTPNPIPTEITVGVQGKTVTLKKGSQEYSRVMDSFNTFEYFLHSQAEILYGIRGGGYKNIINNSIYAELVFDGSSSFRLNGVTISGTRRILLVYSEESILVVVSGSDDYNAEPIIGHLAYSSSDFSDVVSEIVGSYETEEGIQPQPVPKKYYSIYDAKRITAKDSGADSVIGFTYSEYLDGSFPSGVPMYSITFWESHLKGDKVYRTRYDYTFDAYWGKITDKKVTENDDTYKGGVYGVYRPKNSIPYGYVYFYNDLYGVCSVVKESLVKIESCADANKFIDIVKNNVYYTEQPYDEVYNLIDCLLKYDDAFFEENVIYIYLHTLTSDSRSTSIDSIGVEGTTLKLVFREFSASTDGWETDMMAGDVYVLTFDREDMKGVKDVKVAVNDDSEVITPVVYPEPVKITVGIGGRAIALNAGSANFKNITALVNEVLNSRPKEYSYDIYPKGLDETRKFGVYVELTYSGEEFLVSGDTIKGTRRVFIELDSDYHRIAIGVKDDYSGKIYGYVTDDVSDLILAVSGIVNGKNAPTVKKTFDGCTYTLILDRASYAEGDPVIATVLLENKGDKTIYLYKSDSGNYLNDVDFYENGVLKPKYSSYYDLNYFQAEQHERFEPGDVLVFTDRFTVSGDFDAKWEITAAMTHYDEYVDSGVLGLPGEYKGFEKETLTIEVPHESAKKIVKYPDPVDSVRIRFFKDIERTEEYKSANDIPYGAKVYYLMDNDPGYIFTNFKINVYESGFDVDFIPNGGCGIPVDYFINNYHGDKLEYSYTAVLAGDADGNLYYDENDVNILRKYLDKDAETWYYYGQYGYNEKLDYDCNGVITENDLTGLLAEIKTGKAERNTMSEHNYDSGVGTKTTLLKFDKALILPHGLHTYQIEYDYSVHKTYAEAAVLSKEIHDKYDSDFYVTEDIVVIYCYTKDGVKPELSELSKLWYTHNNHMAYLTPVYSDDNKGQTLSEYAIVLERQNNKYLSTPAPN